MAIRLKPLNWAGILRLRASTRHRWQFPVTFKRQRFARHPAPASNLFRLAVRQLRLVFLYRGLETFPTVVIHVSRAFRASDTAEALNSFIVCAWRLAEAYWLLAGAKWLFKLVFPASPNEPKAWRLFETACGLLGK